MKTKITAYLAVLITLALGEQSQADIYEKIMNDMVWIPPGTFTMGSPDTEVGRYPDETQHRVTISHGFYISKYETSRREFYVTTGLPFYELWEMERPEEGVNGTEVLHYCSNLTEIERKAGRLPKGYIFRIPTEAEWEYACRAGTTTATSYGESLSSNQANFNGDYPYNTSDTGPNLRETVSVGSYKPNAWGLYDMHGNAWEWCLDRYGDYPKEATVDPRGPSSGIYQVVRGGNFDNEGSLCRSAFRGNYDSRIPNNNIGFRVVLAWDFSTWVSEVFGNLTPETRKTYSCDIERQEGNENLVVVIHGWIRKEKGQMTPPDPTWVDDMVKAIRPNLESRGLKKWQVEGYKWKEKAWFKTPFSTLLDNADAEGVNLGNCLKKQGWKHIHFITHSAGAVVGQTASLLVKENDIRTTIHTTFLDAYVGLTYGGRSKYGLASDWSDSYFARDPDTVDVMTGLTGGHLDYSYSVDVTQLDQKTSLGTFRSSWNGDIEECFQTVTSHGWPYKFYLETITGVLTEAETKGFGFPLSKEGGKWDFALSQYKAGNSPPFSLGSPDPPCIPDISLPEPDWNPIIDFIKPLIMKSATGASQVSASGVTLTTGSPVWLTALVPITNNVNLVSFDSQFLSNGAEGLLSVYGNTNVIGSIDERVALKGLCHYTFSLPTTITNGTYPLSFRLDAFSPIQSSVMVTNVALGFAGIKDPFSLSFTGASNNGLPVLQLTGPSGYKYRVESSTNLVDWATIAILVNTNGTVRFVDQSLTNVITRFYRAVAP